MTPNIQERSNRKFKVGEYVFVKPINARCTQRWNNGVVTGVGSGVQIEVDGIPRHIADIRAVPKEEFKELDKNQIIRQC